MGGAKLKHVPNTPHTHTQKICKHTHTWLIRCGHCILTIILFKKKRSEERYSTESDDESLEVQIRRLPSKNFASRSLSQNIHKEALKESKKETKAKPIIWLIAAQLF